MNLLSLFFYLALIFPCWSLTITQQTSTSTTFVNITDIQGFNITKSDNPYGVGAAISTAGDINGDGIDDIIVNSPLTGSAQGTVYVIFGTKGGLPNIDLYSFNNTQGFRIIGSYKDNRFGWSVSAAGDVNKDGIADIVVGTNKFMNDADHGAVYVIYGKKGGFSDFYTQDFNSTQGFLVTGIPTGQIRDQLPTVSGAGDINGDGFDDILIGAGDPNNRVYVILGGQQGAFNISVSNLTDQQGYKIVGVKPGDWFGNSVAGLGDINGDGLDDIIVGAALENKIAGAAYVIYGSKSGLSGINLTNLTSTQGFKIIGSVETIRVGEQVRNAGDVNGDGINDIALTFASTKAIFTSCVIYGNRQVVSDIDITKLDITQGFLVTGQNFFAAVELAGIGDVNGDGFDDIIAGISSYGSYAGATYIIFGRSGGIENVNVNFLDETQGFAIQGSSPRGQFGYSSAPAGDVNKDGIADILIASAPAPNGVVYVVYGARNLPFNHNSPISA